MRGDHGNLGQAVYEALDRMGSGVPQKMAMRFSNWGQVDLAVYTDHLPEICYDMNIYERRKKKRRVQRQSMPLR